MIIPIKNAFVFVSDLEAKPNSRRNKKVLPETIDRPILVFFETKNGDRVQIIYPDGKTDAWDFHGVLPTNNGYPLDRVENPYQFTLNLIKIQMLGGVWKLLHWEYL